MVKRCVMYNCDNTNKTGHALHEFLKEDILLRQWVHFVRVKWADFKPVTQNSQAVDCRSIVCEAHFLPQYYSMKALLVAELSGGLLKWKKTLLPVSVPTVQLQCHAVAGQQKRCSRTWLWVCSATPWLHSGCGVSDSCQMSDQFEMAADLRSAVFFNLMHL